MAASLGHVLAQIQRWASPHLEEFTDAQLLQRFIQDREESAFAALVARHGAMVLHSCRRILGDGHEAEDAFQATFLILARKAPSLRQPDALPGYLHSIARRVALKARARAAIRTRQSPLPDHLSDPRVDPLARLTARELLTVLDEEVARLPRTQRSAVVLCCLEGRTQEEAARLLGWTAGSLRGHLERGRHRLQAQLLRRGITLPSALAIVAVSRGEAASAPLFQNTLKAALHGGIDSTASALAHSVLKTMLLSKLVGGMAVVLTLALAASTTAVLISHGPPAVAPKAKTPAVPVAPKEAGASKQQVRADALGDPLPPGAIARMGTLRLYHYGSLSTLVFSPDNKTVVSAGNFGDIRLWDAATGKELLTIKAYKEPISDVVFSPEGKLLVSSCYLDPTIRVWDTATGAERHRIRGDAEGIRALALSHDGKLLAAAGSDNTIRIWDAAGWKQLRRMTGHAEKINSLAFIPGGKDLISGSEDNTIRIWDAGRGREIRRFSVGPRAFFDFALSWDGKILASRYGRDGIVGLWDAAKAYAAVVRMAADSRTTMTALKERLHPIRPPNPDRLARLLTELDSERFEVREAAERELRKMGDVAEPALRKVLAGKPSVELRLRVKQLLQEIDSGGSSQCLRDLRAVEVLERLGTADARQLLKVLAEGDPNARLTREAKAALERLARP